MKHKLKISVRLLSAFLAMLFVFYVYPTAAIAVEPAVTEAIPYDPPEEAITEEELGALEEYYNEEYVEPDVIGENTDLRDATVKHYRMSDGTFRAVDYGTDVHFKDESDEWTDFDNDLVLNETVDSSDSEDFAGYEPKKNDVKIKFAKNTSSSNLLKLKFDDVQISFGLRDANKSKPVIENGDADPNDPYAVPGVSSKITYPEVFDGVDLVYIVDGSNVKEYFVISEGADIFEYTFDIKVKNVTPSVDEEGNVVFTKADGTVAYTIPKGYMYDSGTGYSDGVTYTLEHVKNKKYTLIVTADQQWITADERVYPVMLDPTVVLNKYADATDVGSIDVRYKNMTTGDVLTNVDHLYVGTSSGEVNNIYLKVPNIEENFGLPANTILCNAFFMLRQLDSATPGFSSTSSSFTQLYVGAYEAKSATDIYNPASTLLDYAVYSASTCGAFSQLDVTPAARRWYNDSSTNNGIVLCAINNTATSYANARFAGCYSSESDLYYSQPRFIISYRHTVGVENYYTYETLDMDRAGSLYLNANTGQAVVINDIITTNNLANPYTVSLVYNSVYAKTDFTNNDAADIHTADYTNMKLGAGWKLNSQISVVKKNLASFIPEQDTMYLVFCDGDGTEHYFAQSSDNTNIYKDEDGLGLQIAYDANSAGAMYTLSDDKGNETVFNYYGYVVNSTDSNGNVIRYNYDTAGDKRKLVSISATNDGGLTKTVATFTYDSSGYLTTITDQYNRKTTLGYNAMSPKELTSIKYPDSKTCSIRYDNDARKISEITDNESLYKIVVTYDSDDNQATLIQESANSTAGSRLSMTYDGSERTTVRYSGNDGTLNTSDDTASVYHFDYFGRCTNVHTVNPDTGKVYGSTSAAYTSPDSGTSKQKNRISASSTTGIQPVNILMNAGAEDEYTGSNIASYFYRPSSLSTGQAVDRSTAEHHTGLASMKVSATTAPSSGLHTWYNISGLNVGYTYTFSAYAKATSFTTTATDGGYYLRVGSNYSVRMTKAGNSGSDEGWIKLSVTFTATTTGATYLYAGFIGATGTVYFDDFQLTVGDDADQVSLISNGNFDNTAKNYWSLAGAEIFDEAESRAGNLSGRRAIQIWGSPTEAKCASLQIPINKSGAYSYVYSGWAYAISVPLVMGDKPNKPTLCLSAYVKYVNDDVYEWHSKSFSADYKDGWQYLSMPIAPKKTNKTVEYIKLFVAYDYNGNDVCFDNMSLVADNATSYKYDENGNVIAANSTNTSEITASYSGADLTGYTAATGANYTYTYDDAHNVKTASWAGVTNSLTYTAAGLTNASTLSDGTNSIKTTAQYDDYGKLTSETNQLNKTTSYTYNSANGSLQRTTYPDGSAMSYTTNSLNNRLTRLTPMTSGNGYSSQTYLTYSKGRLATLKTGVTDYNETYTLTYNNFGDMTKLTVGNITLAQNTYNQYTGALATSLTPGGATLSYKYDNLGRLTSVMNGDTTVSTAEYNSRGNVLRSTDVDKDVVTSYLYDSIGRTTGIMKQDTSNVFKQLSTYVYDSASRLKNRLYYYDFLAGNLYETYNYNSNGLLSSKVATKGSVLTPTYNDLKQVSRVKVSHNDTYYKDYDYVDVSTTRTTNLPNKISYTDNNATSPFLTYDYTYDTMSRVTSVKKNGTTSASYTYDGFGNLVGVSQGGASYSYTYGYTGNIEYISKTVNGVTTAKDLQYDDDGVWKDRLIAVDGAELVYSDTAPGLPTTYQNGRTYQFNWTDQGQLFSSYENNKVTSFTYYSNGLRATKRNSADGLHYYYYDGDRLVAEKWQTKYLLYHYDENDSIFAITYNNGTSEYTYQLLKNLQGDVVAILNAANSVIATYEYDAWGNLLSIKNEYNVDITNSTGYFANINPIRYRGYYYDTETGFYYLKSRYYDPANCRFISADSLLVINPAINGLNLFAYCSNNPVNASDPNGYFTWWDFVDVGFFLYSWGVFGSNPSWGNFGEALLDTISLLPIIPSSGCLTKADDAIDVASGLLKSDLPLGALKHGDEVVSSTTTLYRSISDAEALDIKTTGRFNLSPYGMDTKQFGFDLFETRKFGQFFSQGKIVSVQIPTNMLSKFDPAEVDAFLFKHGTLTVHGDQLEYFNSLVQGTINFVP